MEIYTKLIPRIYIYIFLDVLQRPSSKFLSRGGGGYFWLRNFCLINFLVDLFSFCKRWGGGA